ncbi:MAG TPA: MFS transporter [Vicinamibacterales bacterium]|nr:MFS transporter [Vicinamibacterales bacterium]
MNVARALPWTGGSGTLRLGWVNVVVAAFLMLATLPGRTQGLGLITEPLLRDLHLDRITYANINLWATLAGAIACLPIGRVLDRVGLRWTSALLCAALSIVVWQMSAFAGGVALLFVLIFLTRAIGQSALSVASITAVGKSFDRNVGIAMGVYSVLLSVFFAIAFVWIGGVVSSSGWRAAWMQVAVALALFITPITALFLREPGAVRATEVARVRGDRIASSADVPSANLSLGEALGTPAFWVFAGATSVFGLVSSGLGLFNEAVLAERGFDQQTYHQFLAASAVLALVGQFACGWLTIRWSMQRLLGLAMFIYAIALFALPSIATFAALWTFAVLIGVSGGMVTVIFFAIWRRFGADHLGRIQGAAQMLTVLASAIGPLLFATCASWTGSYTPVLWTLAPGVLLLSVAALKVAVPVGPGTLNRDTQE